MTQGEFVPQQPVFGPGKGNTKSTRFIKRYVRTFRVLQSLARLDFDSCLDVGAAEGYTSALVKRLFGSTAVPADATTRAGAAARHFYGLDPVCVDAHRLPFRAGSFDLVVSTETVEHLTHPVEAVLEMLRVAKKAVLVSTCEATRSPTLAWIASKLARYDRMIPVGGHINFFRGADFRTLLGDSTALGNQFIKPGLSPRSGRALRYTGQDREEIKARLRTITWTRGYLPGSRGIVALRVLDPTASRGEPRLSDEALLDEILSHAVEVELGTGAADAATTTLPPRACGTASNARAAGARRSWTRCSARARNAPTPARWRMGFPS
jgi:SAM-dependent methyltransferase